MDVITFPCWDYIESMLVLGPLVHTEAAHDNNSNEEGDFYSSSKI